MRPRATTPLRRLGLGLLLGLATLVHLPAAERLRVGLVADAAASGSDRDPLFRALVAADADVVIGPRQADGTLSLEPLREADAVVFLHGPGRLASDGSAALRAFLGAGKGLVVLGATREAWAAVPEFFSAILGATPGERFAGGAAMNAISLYPHPIFTGVPRFETQQAMPAFAKLADDAQLIMEGVVGEETTPLAWVRRHSGGRLCHLVPAEPATLADPAFQRIVTNAVRWAAVRPVPGATANVQRTFMPESHPGSFAITFPGGPGVCLDPVRGGINFIWDGDFVDLRPRWLTKQGAPARVFGPAFYREKNWQPLRVGAPAHEAHFQFCGYALKEGGPEFHYQVDGRDVFEQLTARADGTVLTRRFHVAAGPGPLWIALEPQADAEIVTTGLARDGALASFASPEAGEFTIEIRRKTPGASP